MRVAIEELELGKDTVAVEGELGGSMRELRMETTAAVGDVGIVTASLPGAPMRRGGLSV